MIQAARSEGYTVHALMASFRRLCFVPVLLIAAAAVWVTVFGGLDDPAAQPPASGVAVTTTWLESCVRDLAADRIQVIRLAPPGMCPGHFDLEPAQAARLAGCRLLLRFAFQAGLDRKLASLSGQGPLRIVPVDTGQAGLCIPSTYLAACFTVAERLEAIEPGLAPVLKRRLRELKASLGRLDERLRAEVRQAGLAGVPVLSSAHQARFCEYLGLRPLGRFGRAESMSPAELSALIELGRAHHVRLIIANQQEGLRAARTLGDRLECPVVTFSNFPRMDPAQDGFSALVRDNLDRLLETAAESR